MPFEESTVEGEVRCEAVVETGSGVVVESKHYTRHKHRQYHFLGCVFGLARTARLDRQTVLIEHGSWLKGGLARLSGQSGQRGETFHLHLPFNYSYFRLSTLPTACTVPFSYAHLPLTMTQATVPYNSSPWYGQQKGNLLLDAARCFSSGFQITKSANLPLAILPLSSSMPSTRAGPAEHHFAMRTI